MSTSSVVHEALDQDSSLEPALVPDQLVAERAVQIDDHELLVTLEGCIGGPDRRGGVCSPRQAEVNDEWDLDAPLAADEDGDGKRVSC